MACRTATTPIAPHTLTPHARQLVTDGEATIVGLDGQPIELDADKLVDVHVQDVDGDTQRPMRLSIRDLVAGCVDDAQASTCLAVRVRSEPGIEYRRLVFDKERTASLIAVGLIGGAAGYALAVAGTDADVAKVGYVGLGVVAAMGLLVLGFALH